MAGQYETRLFIAGEFCDPVEKQYFPLRSAVDPDGAPIAQVPIATLPDIDRAIAAGKTAQVAWFALPASARSTVLLKMADLIVRDGETLKKLDSVAMGRPVGGQVIDVMVAAGRFRAMAGLGAFVHGESSLNTPGLLSVTLKQPYGVVGAIIPWNVPMIMWAQKVAPAVAAGNAIVLKTSEKAPLACTHLAALAHEAGFPAGLINVISGAGETGKILSEHMEIRAISFTGSTATGRRVLAASAASNLKKVSLELGGKSPTIIFDDADLNEAIPACTFSIAWNSGQVCVANSRLYVQESIYPTFLAKFKEAFGGQTHGDPSDAKTMLGPQADKLQGERVLSYLEVGKREGKVALGGDRVAGKSGYFIQPTIFTDVADNARIQKEEIFGPVTIINTFKDEAEAVRRANDSEYGLYAAVFSQNIDRALRVAKALDAGCVGVNATSPTLGEDMPFGGYKQSGLGREGGEDALEEWLETKAVAIKIKGF
jgi:aldehyde dehydrogenase (NAD+)